MPSAAHDFANVPRALLQLGRVANLPTVWSNCLAGWLLGGGGEPAQFFRLCAGATCLYLGGLFLNDAFDAEFDRQFRPERPIPAGAISERGVWLWGLAWMGLGTLCLVWLESPANTLAFSLVGAILLYDTTHKWISFAPLLMGLCRSLLYLVAASAGAMGLSGLAVWSALALGAYVAGLSYLAVGESAPRSWQRWTGLLLVVPVVLALLVNDGEFRQRGMVVAAVVAFWLFRSLRLVLGSISVNPQGAVASLLAGIVLVDLLAVAGCPPQFAAYLAVFPLFFVTALVLQRFAPAT